MVTLWKRLETLRQQYGNTMKTLWKHNGNTMEILCQHCGILFALLLFYAIATVLRLYLGSDMIYGLRRRKPKPTLLLTQRIFNLAYKIGMELAVDAAVSYTQQRKALQHS